MSYVYALGEIPKEKEGEVGGKALSLHRMIRELGLPVPEGYAIAKDAFAEGEVLPKAREEILGVIESLDPKFAYAVRSSAIGEDGLNASFAGQYETVTDVRKEKVFDALKEVAASACGSRVKGYGESFSMEGFGMAAVIQRFVKPEFAGVLFTTDPVTGRDDVMVGNYVAGEGEKLVSGQENASVFTIQSNSMTYEGEVALRPYGKKLGRYCLKIRRAYGCPMDVEWAVSGGKVYILQARPITTLRRADLETFEVNGSLSGRKLLTRTNVGEIFLQSVSPMTFSVLEKINELLGLPDWLDNVCGQPYMNISVVCAAMVSFGMSKEKAFQAVKDLVGNVPEGLEIPLTYFDKRAFLGRVWKLLFPKTRSKLTRRQKHQMVEDMPAIARELMEEIRKIGSRQELLECWEKVLIPKLNDGLASIFAECGTSMIALFTTRGKIAKIAGEEMARKLCGGCTGTLDSMKPVLYLVEVAKGRMSREEYMAACGHRCAAEMELMAPRPYEDPDYLDKLLADYEKNETDLAAMQEMERRAFEESLAVFKNRYPAKSKWIHKRLEAFARANAFREDIRSKGVYVFCVFREFLLKAGSLCGLGEDVFMLTVDEVFEVLKGQERALQFVKKRRETFERNAGYPCFPNLILGRFLPEEWLADPNAGRDCYAEGATGEEIQSNDEPAGPGDPAGKSVNEEPLKKKKIPENQEIKIKGFPGAAGKITGTVRVIEDVARIVEIQKGDILVTGATNIGWTLAFPKVSAIITDIGAPLSHAAIVAREFGIPAVVGCGNATTVLKTGDVVIVDGAAGTVTRQQGN